MRDHKGIVLEEFNGLWKRGDANSVPLDHFSDCGNIQYVESGFKTRDGIDAYLPYPNVSKIYSYSKVNSESLLILDAAGNLFDSGSPTPYTPILTISTMVDFGFAVFAGRAYISPNTTITGMPSEFLYVYKGDGTPARKAAGNPPVDADGALAAANSGSSGNVEAGIHIFGAVYETDTGFLTAIGPNTLPTVTAPGGDSVDLSNIPVSPSSAVTKVRIVATRAIDPSLYTGNTRGYQFFFVPGAIVNNGTTTLTVSFFDVELLEDASHLFDLFAEIPAGVGLTTYHGRMILYTTAANPSVIYASNPGEPEAFNQVDGLLVLQADNTPITICQEWRDVLYIFKPTRTFGASDNNDVPSSWPITVLDQGMGAALHGIATVLDTGGVNIDFLIVANFSGIYLFNGSYTRPELSWKIETLWNNFFNLTKQIRFSIDTLVGFDVFRRIEIYNNSIDKIIYVILFDAQQLLIGDYRNGLDFKNIRWGIWTFPMPISTIALTNFNNLIIGSKNII